MPSNATMFGLPAIPLALGVLIATYAAIVSERINRAVAALLGGAAMLFVGLIDQDGAIRGIDWNTIALLTGMMILVAVAKRSGMFEAVAIAAAHLVRAHPAALLAVLQLVTAVLSALLDNVTTVLLVVPVTLVVTGQLKLDAFPFLISEIIASNIGGTATLIGDPPNILIGSSAHLNFVQFLWHLTPIAAVALAAQIGLGHVLWGRTLRAAAPDRAFVLAETPHGAIADWRLLRQSLVVLGAVIVCFILAHQIGVEPGTTALAGGALLLLLDTAGRPESEQTHRVERILAEVDWVTIFFFIGLFVVVAGVERSGLLGMAAHGLIAGTQGLPAALAIAILWGSALLSAVFDNIPYVATMIPIVKQLALPVAGEQGRETLWWALALGACLGGNGTLIGASANLAVAGLAEQAGQPIHFWAYFRYGFPMMLMSIALAMLYLWLRYLVLYP